MRGRARTGYIRLTHDSPSWPALPALLAPARNAPGSIQAPSCLNDRGLRLEPWATRATGSVMVCGHCGFQPRRRSSQTPRRNQATAVSPASVGRFSRLHLRSVSLSHVSSSLNQPLHDCMKSSIYSSRGSSDKARTRSPPNILPSIAPSEPLISKHPEHCSLLPPRYPPLLLPEYSLASPALVVTRRLHPNHPLLRTTSCTHAAWV